MFEQLFNNALFYSLSLTLLHFLWQGLLVALILKLALFLIDDSKSKTRYTLATLAMLSNIAIALFTFSTVYPESNANLGQPKTLLVTNISHDIALSESLSYQELIVNFITTSLPYLSMIWLVMVSFLACKLLIQVRNVNQLSTSACISPSSDLLIRFERLSKQINLTKTPRLLISLKTNVPMAIGWIKPVVLLPASMVSGLDSAQLEMLILHELAHIRRHDYLVNFLQSIIELLFFFHPCVHWIGKQMRHEREYCSDDIAVSHCGDAVAYAHTLANTASICNKKHNHTIPAMAMAASGGDLKNRVMRLVGHHCAPSNYTSKSLAAVSLLLALILLSISHVLTTPLNQKLTSQSSIKSHNLNSNSLPTLDSNQVASPMLLAEKRTLVSASITTLATEFLEPSTPVASPVVMTPSAIKETKTSMLVTPISEAETSTAQTSILPSVEGADTEISTVTSNESPAIDSIEYDSENVTTLAAQKENELNTQAVATISQSIEETTELGHFSETTEIAELSNKNEEFKTTTELAFTKAEVVKPQSEVNSLTLHALKTPTSVNKVQIAKVADEKVFAAINENENSGILTASTLTAENALQLTTMNQLHSETAKPLTTAIQASQLSQDLAHASSAIYSINNNPILSAPLSLSDYVLEQKEAIDAVKHKAKLVSSIIPKYPKLAKRRKIEMEVKVNFTIDEHGKVKDINFNEQSKLSYFKAAVQSAVSQWRFTPATVNNNTVESKMSKIFSFSLGA